MDAQHLRNELRTFISTQLIEDGPVELDDTTNLIDSWILDSLKITQLIAHAERTWGVRVPPESVNLSHFESIRAIADLIGSLPRS